MSYGDSHQSNTRCKLCANEAVSLLFSSFNNTFLCSPGSPCLRPQTEDLGSPKHDGTLAASAMAQSARTELEPPVMGDTGCFLAHIRPDDTSGKAGLHSSNARMAPHLRSWERAAGGGSSCISGPVESRQRPRKLSGSWLCPASAIHLQCPI